MQVGSEQDTSEHRDGKEPGAISSTCDERESVRAPTTERHRLTANIFSASGFLT